MDEAYVAAFNARSLGEPKVLLEQAIAAEERWQFEEAYRLNMLASRAYEESQDSVEGRLALVRAAVCLEKSQSERAHAAVWETIGDRVGTQLDPSNPFLSRDAPGQSGIFHVTSMENWRRPKRGYYGDNLPAILRHQQILAYLWAGEESERCGRHGHAAYLYRKAAIAWENSAWGERDPSTADALWSGKALGEHYGGKWERAADTYFRAARANVRDDSRIKGAYSADVTVGWGSHQAGDPAESRATGTDIDRMTRALDAYADTRAEFQKRSGEVFAAKTERINVLGQKAHRLVVLQDLLARHGARKEAAHLYRQRHLVLVSIDRLRRAPLFALRWAFHRATGSGSSIPATLGSLAVVYVLLFPAVFLAGGLLVEGPGSAAPPGFGDAVLFSLAAAVTLSAGAATTNSVFGAFVAVLEAVSAYFGFGFVLWMMFRSYEE